MIKYCDICNKETEKITEYVLPESSYDYATDKYGNKIIRIETFKPIKKDLCPTCEVLLNRLINLLPIASIDETYKISLIKEDKS